MLPGQDNSRRGKLVGKNVFIGAVLLLSAQLIVDDPKNRRGDQYQDENGSYSYYTDESGEAYTDFIEVEEAEYRVIEIGEDKLELHDQKIEPECPELQHNTEEDLQAFCLHRDEDGFCTELEQPCVLLQEE